MLSEGKKVQRNKSLKSIWIYLWSYESLIFLEQYVIPRDLRILTWSLMIQQSIKLHLLFFL